jgi:hypothetical protein
MGPDIEDRVISLGNGLAAIPERLLLAHARGEVLFICGAGISRPAGLPDFRELVLDVWRRRWLLPRIRRPDILERLTTLGPSAVRNELLPSDTIAELDQDVQLE